MESMQLFQLCEAGDSAEGRYFLFNELWDYHFYKNWCFNQGGFLSSPESAEEFTNELDIAQRLVKRELHEKCVDSSGVVIYWMSMNDIDIEGNHILGS